MHNQMKWTAASALGAVLLNASIALAQAPPPPPGPVPPLTTVDEVNAMILVDVSGSMASPHASGMTKFEVGMERARDFVLDRVAASTTPGDEAEGKPLEFALWAFDSTFPSGDGYTYEILSFPATAQQVLSALGYDSVGNPTPSTRSPTLAPTGATPLAAGACFAGTELVASLTQTGGLIEPGYEWKKTKANGQLAEIRRYMKLISDGLENATPAGNECGGITSTETYENFEANSWQARLRNKLLTGHPERTNTEDSGLVIDVDLIFQDFISGLSGGSLETPYAAGASYSTAPDLAQALEFYEGLTEDTGGTFQTVTVSASGGVEARRPGDVNRDGCVDMDDYNIIITWYSYPVNPNVPATEDADLDGDGYVDYNDYLILTENWGNGC